MKQLIILFVMATLAVSAKGQSQFRQEGEIYINVHGGLEYHMISNSPPGKVSGVNFYQEEFQFYGFELGKSFENFDLGLVFMKGTQFGRTEAFMVDPFYGELQMYNLWDIGLMMRKYSGVVHLSMDYNFVYGWTLRTSYLQMDGDEYVGGTFVNEYTRRRRLDLASIDGGFFFEVGHSEIFKKSGVNVTFNLEPVYVRATNKGLGFGFFRLGTVVRF